MRNIIFVLLFAMAFSSEAVITFQKFFGGDNDDFVSSIFQTNDEGYIISGTSDSFNKNPYNNLTIKIDKYGIEEWRNIFGYGSSTLVSTIQADNDELIIGSQFTSNDTTSFYLTKINYSGVIIWQNFFCFDSPAYLSAIDIKNNGDLIITATTGDYAIDTDILLILCDSNGNILWNKRFGEIGDEKKEFSKDVIFSQDGNILVSGRKTYRDENIGYVWSAWAFKVNELGSIIWDMEYEINIDYDYTERIIETNDSNFFILGNTYSYTGDCESSWLKKINSYGTLIWNKIYDNFQFTTLRSIDHDNNGSIILVGSSLPYNQYNSDILLIKTDVNGNEIWNQVYGGDDNEFANSTSFTQDNGIILACHSNSFSAGDYDILIIKTDENGNTTNIQSNDYFNKKIILNQNYPNPFNPTTTIQFSILKDQNIKLSIFDIHGNEIDVIIEGGISAGQHSIEFDGSKLTSGQYFYKIETEYFTEIKKMILLK